MEQEAQTFPTLRRWRGMSEREQDAFLDRVEARRRWRNIAVRGVLVLAGLVALASVVVLVSAL